MFADLQKLPKSGPKSAIESVYSRSLTWFGRYEARVAILITRRRRVPECCSADHTQRQRHYTGQCFIASRPSRFPLERHIVISRVVTNRRDTLRQPAVQCPNTKSATDNGLQCSRRVRQQLAVVNTACLVDTINVSNSGTKREAKYYWFRRQGLSYSEGYSVTHSYFYNCEHKNYFKL